MDPNKNPNIQPQQQPETTAADSAESSITLPSTHEASGPFRLGDIIGRFVDGIPDITVENRQRKLGAGLIETNNTIRSLDEELVTIDRVIGEGGDIHPREITDVHGLLSEAQRRLRDLHRHGPEPIGLHDASYVEQGRGVAQPKIEPMKGDDRSRP